MLDELFEESKHKRNVGHYGHDNRPDAYGKDSDGRGGQGDHNPLLDLLQKILRNRALLAVIVCIILVIGAVAVWLVITMLPYLGQAVSVVEKQGIKGIQEMITPFLQKIWEGTGK